MCANVSLIKEIFLYNIFRQNILVLYIYIYLNGYNSGNTFESGEWLSFTFVMCMFWCQSEYLQTIIVAVEEKNRPLKNIQIWLERPMPEI